MYGLFWIMTKVFKHPTPVGCFEKPEPLKVLIACIDSAISFADNANEQAYWSKICTKCGWDSRLRVVSVVLSDFIKLINDDETGLRINYFNTETGEYGCKPLIRDDYTYILEKLNPIALSHEPDSR